MMLKWNCSFVKIKKANPDKTKPYIAKVIYTTHMDFVRDLKTFGYVNRYAILAPRNLIGNTFDPNFICGSLVARNKIHFGKID